MARTLCIADYAVAAPYSIASNCTLTDAHRLMNALRVHHLPVVEVAKLVGVVSQRDLYFLETIHGVDPDEVQIEEAMNRAPYVVAAHTPLRVAVRHLCKHRLDSALVVEKRQVVAIFTLTDALQALSDLLAPKSSHPKATHEHRNGR